MQEFTPEGLRTLGDLARRHGISEAAALTLLRALVAGNGVAAQFNHPELGGMGQWSRGGMIQIGDMFNHALKHRVDALCSELADLLAHEPRFASVPSNTSQPGRGQAPIRAQSGFHQTQSQSHVHTDDPGHDRQQAGPFTDKTGGWWPADLGAASSTGAQNGVRYAYFPAGRRLAVEERGRVTVYDTGNHQISGFSQQQSGSGAFLTFTSQRGLHRVADLPVVVSGSPAQSSATSDDRITSGLQPTTPPRPNDDPLLAIERLADLHRKGIITDEEFAAKKAELLGRL